MPAVPPDIPVTTPDPPLIVATVVLSLLHVPPVVASDNKVVELAQTTSVPVTTSGKGFTVTTADETQPGSDT